MKRPWRSNRPFRCTQTSAISPTPRLSLLNSVELLLDRGDAEQARVRLRQAEELMGELPDPPSPLRQLYAGMLDRTTAEGAPG